MNPDSAKHVESLGEDFFEYINSITRKEIKIRVDKNGDIHEIEVDDEIDKRKIPRSSR